jgi:hypothetical protein
MKQDQTLRGNVEPLEVQSEKIRYGAPDGPRHKRRGKYDGRSPLNYPGHEAVAQYLAAPKSLREFRSDMDLAKHFQVTRMTIYRWKNDVDVMQRAYWLSMRNQMAGDLVARREWPQIMEKAVEMAKRGDVHAMKFCESRAWAEDLRVEQSQLSASVSIEDLLGTGEGDGAEELQDDNRQAEGGDR